MIAADLTWTQITALTLAWLLILATAWVGFLMWFRVRALKGRERVRLHESRFGALGVSAPDEADPEHQPMTDAEEALREQIARTQRRVMRQVGNRTEAL